MPAVLSKEIRSGRQEPVSANALWLVKINLQEKEWRVIRQHGGQPIYFVLLKVSYRIRWTLHSHVAAYDFVGLARILMKRILFNLLLYRANLATASLRNRSPGMTTVALPGLTLRSATQKKKIGFTALWQCLLSMGVHGRCMFEIVRLGMVTCNVLLIHTLSKTNAIEFMSVPKSMLRNGQLDPGIHLATPEDKWRSAVMRIERLPHQIKEEFLSKPCCSRTRIAIVVLLIFFFV